MCLLLPNFGFCKGFVVVVRKGWFGEAESLICNLITDCDGMLINVVIFDLFFKMQA